MLGWGGSNGISTSAGAGAAITEGGMYIGAEAESVGSSVFTGALAGGGGYAGSGGGMPDTWVVLATGRGRGEAGGGTGAGLGLEETTGLDAAAAGVAQAVGSGHSAASLERVCEEVAICAGAGAVGVLGGAEAGAFPGSPPRTPDPPALLELTADVEPAAGATTGAFEIAGVSAGAAVSGTSLPGAPLISAELLWCDADTSADEADGPPCC